MIICKTCGMDVTNSTSCNSKICNKSKGYLEWKSQAEMNFNHENVTLTGGWRLPTIGELRMYGQLLRNHRTNRIGWYWSSTKSTNNPKMTICYHLKNSTEKNIGISKFVWVCFVKDKPK